MIDIFVTFGVRCSLYLRLLLKLCFIGLQMEITGELTSGISDIFDLLVRTMSCLFPHRQWYYALPLGLLSPQPPQHPPCSHSSVWQSQCLQNKSFPLAGVESLKQKQRGSNGQFQRTREESSHKDKGWLIFSDCKHQEYIASFGIVFTSSSKSCRTHHWQNVIKAKVHSCIESLQEKRLTSVEHIFASSTWS